MRFSLLMLILLPLLCIAADCYIFFVIRRRCNLIWLKTAHIALSILLYAMLGTAFCLVSNSSADASLVAAMWLIFSFFSIYIPKFFFVIFDLIARIPKRRLKWLSDIGLGLATLLFMLFWWGALINRFSLDINEKEVEIAELPDDFDGYKIVQISDMHVGTYLNDTTFVKKIVKTVNEQNPDLILFTGDIVTRHSRELEPFVATLRGFRAKDGAFAVLGNHDYAAYAPELRGNEEARSHDLQHLRDLYSQTSLKLLEDSHTFVRRGNDSIAIIGVGNIGRPPFPSAGSLHRAYPDIEDKSIKILMSHDPAHWEDSIRNNPATNIALTLSGHTHAMQTKLFGLSPAAMAENYWGGLYSDTLGRQLNVNIGTGTVGMPARIGATPEITVITLRKK